MIYRVGVVTASFLFLISACGQGGPAGSADIEAKIKSGKTLASLNGVEVHEGYLELLEEVNPNIAGQLKTPAGKKRLVDNLLEQEVFHKESVKRGIQKNTKYQEKAALYSRVIMSQGLLEEEIETKAKEYYDQNKDSEFSQVKVSHILIRTQNPSAKNKSGITEEQALAKAKEAKKKLDGGTKWEEVVEEYSDDRLTKSRGGDLGKISKQDRRVGRLGWQELVDKAFAMQAGEISEPIKAKDGYHIVKIDEAAQVASFEEVETRIKFKLRGQVKKDILAELTKGGGIVYEDETLKEAASMPQPPTRPGLPMNIKPRGKNRPVKINPAQIQAAKPEAKKAEAKKTEAPKSEEGKQP